MVYISQRKNNITNAIGTIIELPTLSGAVPMISIGFNLPSGSKHASLVYPFIDCSTGCLQASQPGKQKMRCYLVCNLIGKLNPLVMLMSSYLLELSFSRAIWHEIKLRNDMTGTILLDITKVTTRAFKWLLLRSSIGSIVIVK